MNERCRGSYTPAPALEILQDELSSMSSDVTPDTLALLDSFLAVRDTPILASPMDLAINPSTLYELNSAHIADALPIAEAEAAETVETSNDPDEEP
ncbi:hypothetical protein ACQP0C_37250 [Nocardia sp. CA-129566]|uniref:hypothetical protein n=1 Tax=Nocardia sp. CA-129566 TaxID=3239976 RepID=UPI003D9530D6